MAEVIEEPEVKGYKQVTEENVKEALRADKGSGAHLVSWRIQDFTNKGDNYACIVTSVVVKYILEGIQQETTYVAKFFRDFGPESSFQDMMQFIFVKEGSCLKDILPEMNKVMKQIGHHGIRWVTHEKLVREKYCSHMNLLLLCRCRDEIVNLF